MTMGNKYFSKEVSRGGSMTCPCGCDATMSVDTMKALNTLREAYGKPVMVEQGATCKKYSVEKVGRSETSTHIDNGDGALAVDIKSSTFGSKEDYFHFISCAYNAGFMGFGQGEGLFDVHKSDKRLHIDMRDTADIVTWLYRDSH